MTSPWPPPVWDPPSLDDAAVPPPPPVEVAPRPRAAAVWMGICALAGLAGAASVFVPWVYVNDRGYGGFDPSLNDRLTAADVSTNGAAIIFGGSLLALVAAATMMRALDQGSRLNWRLTGLLVLASGAVTEWGATDAYTAVEKVFGAPDAELWGPGIPIAVLAATANLVVGLVLVVLPTRSAT